LMKCYFSILLRNKTTKPQLLLAYDANPLGLSGEDISIEGRIVAVADVFDALSSKRPYKQVLPFDRCIEIIEEGRGTRFDPKVADAFMACRAEIVDIRKQFAEMK
jgi:putative two-component system response regulator